MRIKLIFSFGFIVLVSIFSVVLIARIGAADAVRAYMFRGGMFDSEELVSTLAKYYQSHLSWQGVENVFFAGGSRFGTGHSGQAMGHGAGSMMMQRYRLADSNGVLLLDSAGAEGGKLNTAELNSAIPIMVDKEIKGYLLLNGGMNFSRSDETRLVNRLSRAAITAGFIAGAISLILALILAYGLLRPIQDITQAAINLAKGDLSQRVKVRGRDELSVLGNTFNKMAESLQHAEASRKAITADIAHELRNPLAVQQANLEALQDGIYQLSAENLQPVLEQNQLLTRLVEDLRTLALADAGNLDLEKTPVDLIGLINRIVDRYLPQAMIKGVSVQSIDSQKYKDTSMVYVDPMRIEQILGNLLSNALRHTPQGGVLEIEVFFLRDSVKITVRDSGPGIPDDALPFIFDRFYRVDRARSRTDGGTGLGLAIARQLAEAHGGSLDAANHSKGGAIFTLTIPIESDQ